MRKLTVMGIIVLLFGTGILPSTIGTIEKKTMVANPTSRGYIQGLIDNASDGDTIFIPSGIYYENIIINKSINLVGEDKETTIIDGSNIGDVVNIIADWVNISGFTIQNSGTQYPTDISGIHILCSKYSTIANNTISNNWCGIYLGSLGSNNNTNNNIIGNTISFNTLEGIKLLGYSNYIEGNTISNNKIGITLGGSNNSIIGNNISFNILGGVILIDSRDAIIYRNNFFDNKPNAKFVYYREHEWDKEPNRNTWKQNYWNRPRILPKIIIGTLIFGRYGFILISLPWFNIDWRPALKPYDI